MANYSNIVIIYNPNSTGDSPAMAKELAQQLKQRLHVPIALNATRYAGHAEKLAYNATVSKPHVLLVSVSGDGGYHEVINGAQRAVDAGKGSPICLVAPGGNANDHHTSIMKRSPIETILTGHITKLDLLQVRFDKRIIYAHSYIGLGLTPLVATELNRHTLTAFKELWLAMKTYWCFKPFTIETEGVKKSYDSILCTTIPRMAKHLTLALKSDPKDGKFELLLWPHASKIRLNILLIKALFNRPLPVKQLTDFSFKIIKPQPMQLDGELLDLPKNTSVTVSIAPGKLRTLI